MYKACDNYGKCICSARQTRINPVSPMNYTVWMTRTLPDIQMYPTSNSGVEIGKNCFKRA